jgi:hypothetical protein
MRIAHAYGSQLKPAAIKIDLSLRKWGASLGKSCGNVIRIEKWRSHIDPDLSILTKFGDDNSSHCLHSPFPSRWITIAIGKKTSQTADAVAAHLSLTTVGIEDAHSQFFTMLRRESQYETVSSDSKAAVTQVTDPIGIRVCDVVRELTSTTFQQHEVVS